MTIGEDSCLVECDSCGRMVRSSELTKVTDDDTQGYFTSGLGVCPKCLADLRYEAFQIEDEDVYDLEDDE